METDTLIIGAGPAGIQAAIHASRKKVRTVVFGKLAQSSLESAHVENYCCLQGVAHGRELLMEGKKQAEKFGAAFREEDITGIKSDGTVFKLETESGELVTAKSLIFALGIKRNTLDVKGEKEYYGKGVSYCVECDANFFRGKKVTVTGNGSAAASGAVLLTAYASEVALISQKLDVNEKLLQQLTNSGVELLDGAKIGEILGNGVKVTGLRLSDATERRTDGIFIELGAKGAMELAVMLGVELEGEKFNYIKTDKNQRTNVAGIFAAGDICGAPFQLAKAIGEGCVAGINSAEYVRNGTGKRAPIKDGGSSG